MAFKKRAIRTSFTLGEGNFGLDGSNNLSLQGNRVSCVVTKAGGPSMGSLQLTIYGMTLSQMNRLSTLGMAVQTVRRNTITVEAGDDESGYATVFIGTINAAWAAMEAMPEVAFQVEAQTGLLEAVSSAPPASFPGPVSVASAMSSLATQMGLSFQNSGVSVVLPPSYYYGSPRNQAMQIARDANIEWVIDNNVLAIWPKGQARNGMPPLISPETGMVGYPSFTSLGVELRTLFNPSVGYGQKITVQSSLDAANGDWVVYGLDYELDANLPNGSWFTTIRAARPGLGPVVQ